MEREPLFNRKGRASRQHLRAVSPQAAPTKTEPEQTRERTSPVVTNLTATMGVVMTTTGKTTTTGTAASPHNLRLPPAILPSRVPPPATVHPRTRALLNSREYRRLARRLLWGPHPVLFHLMFPVRSLHLRQMYHLQTRPALLVLAGYLLLVFLSGVGFSLLLL